MNLQEFKNRVKERIEKENHFLEKIPSASVLDYAFSVLQEEVELYKERNNSIGDLLLKSHEEEDKLKKQIDSFVSVIKSQNDLIIKMAGH